MRNLRKARASTVGVRMMKWLCLDCREAGRTKNFFRPVDAGYPAGGCPVCGSRQIIDFNVSPVIMLVGGYG